VPKQVDHQARRQEIAEAVCRLAATQGLDAVSLRHVAAEAGVSMGRVQHYFATKDEMLLFTFEAISERYQQRIAAAMSGAAPDGRSALRALLIELLPLNAASRAEAPAMIAFLARAVVEPRLTAPLRDGVAGWTEFIGGLIRSAGGAQSEAVTLLALVDGLMLHVLTGQVDEPAALAALDGYLDRILG
jgi:TetR/AcrR family transcriptional regulator, transcriptional repressor of bet genes